MLDEATVDPERERARALAALEAAGVARAGGDEAARRAALRDAVEAAGRVEDAALFHTATWRLAKAHEDADDAAGVLDALAPLLARTEVRTPGLVSVREAVGPFDHYGPGLRAWPQIARRHADRQGYLRSELRALWAAWIGRHEALGARFLPWWGRAELAWIDAATGKLDAVAALAREAGRLRPHAFEGDEVVHPRAREPHEGPGWLALDLARTWLHAATWADHAREAEAARDALLDQAEELGVREALDLWTLDALLRAEERFGLDGDRRDPGRYAALAAASGIPRAHAARALAWLARHEGRHDEGAVCAQDAVRLAREDHAGPEWIVEALRELAEAGDADAWTEAEAEMARTGVAMARR